MNGSTIWGEAKPGSHTLIEGERTDDATEVPIVFSMEPIVPDWVKVPDDCPVAAGERRRVRAVIERACPCRMPHMSQWLDCGPSEAGRVWAVGCRVTGLWYWMSEET